MQFAMLVTLVSLGTMGAHCTMTDQMRQEALEAHNYLRRNVYPEAAGMALLTWSSELEALADKAAKRCIFEHTDTEEYAGRGENMYQGGRTNFTEILAMMFLERELYDFDKQKCHAGSPDYQGPYGFLPTCGHYLQLVRSDMTTVGCSISACPQPDGSTSNLAVCEYESIFKEPPYRAKKPGEDPCELCGYGGYATDCENGMCVMFDAEKPKRYEGQRKCLNCGELMSYGTYDICECNQNFYGQLCETPKRSKLPKSFKDSCDKCRQDGVECLNGGTPLAAEDQCQCVCSTGFDGKYCETEIEEEDNTLHLYLGGSKRYYSYYPVDKSIWTSAKGKVSRQLRTALSIHCTSGRPQVRLSRNYPATTMNGSLRVGLHAKCGQQYISKSSLREALDSALKRIDGALGRWGVSVVTVD